MKVPIYPFFILTALLTCAYSGFAQQLYQDETIRFYDGLPSDIVLKAQTDARGFLYVATQRGISRYDGYGFIPNPDIRSAISGFIYGNGSFYFHDNVHGLAVVKDIYDKPETIIGNNYEDSDPNNDHFENIFVDSKKRIWCTDFNHIKYFSRDRASRTFIYFAKNKSIENTVSFLEPVKGEVWVFTMNGLFIWNEKTDRLLPYPDAAIAKIRYVSAFQMGSHVILAAEDDGNIIMLNTKNGTIKRFPGIPSGEKVLGLAILNDKNPLLYTRSGIYIKNPDTAEYMAIYQSEKSQINSVFIDRISDLIWVSTNKGLTKLTPVKAIRNYTLPITAPGNIILSINQDHNNTIWLLDNKNNVWSFDASRQWGHYQYTDSQAHFKNIDIIDGLPVLCSDNGLYRIENRRIKKIMLPDLPNTVIKKAILTRGSELWLLCSGIAIQRYTWPGLIKIGSVFRNAASYWTENSWNDIIENTDGTIWMAGWAPKKFGMNFYDRGRNIFIDNSDLAFNRDRSKFFGDYINRIASAKNGMLLFSGYGGINYVKSDGNIVKKIDINSYPIANGRIEGIAEDNTANVVFATGDGLHVYTPGNDRIIRISQIDGIPADDLVYGFKKLTDGRFAIGTDNGFTVVDVEKLLVPVRQNRIELSGVKVDGIARNTDNHFIELSKDETDATISFSNLSFSDRQKVFYRYKFKDQNHWNLLGNTPELRLNHIAPGDYELVIQAGDHLDHWQQRSLKIAITAHPPFYKSVPFFILMALLVISLLTLLNRYLLRKQKEEARYRQRIKESEMQTLRAQMNPHFMFNTLNSINGFIIENKPETASGYLTTFSKLMRNILEYSKEEFITLQNELEALTLYLELEAARLEYSFDYTIDIDKKLRDDETVRIPPLVLQPFVENAIWHGLLHKTGPGNLYISVKRKHDTLSIRIEDDGIGREMARSIKKRQTHHKSYGIDITVQRLEMLNPENTIEIVDLKDGNGNAAGTAVILTLII